MGLLRRACLAGWLSSLAACGGGGASSSPNQTGGASTIINDVRPAGVVVGNATNLTIGGSNFSSGMTVRMTNGSVSSTLPQTSSTPTSISVPVSISAAPPGNYVILSVIAPSGGVLASAVVGVAATAKTLATDIQPIFDSVCTSCHSGASPSGGLDLSSAAAAAALINAYGTGCPTKFRVTPGDARRTSSVLIDKIQAATSGMAACAGGPMPPSGWTLSAQQIQDIVDWVAGGAN